MNNLEDKAHSLPIERLLSLPGYGVYRSVGVVATTAIGTLFYYLPSKCALPIDEKWPACKSALKTIEESN
jgi:hypothetical protein